MQSLVIRSLFSLERCSACIHPRWRVTSLAAIVARVPILWSSFTLPSISMRLQSRCMWTMPDLLSRCSDMTYWELAMLVRDADFRSATFERSTASNALMKSSASFSQSASVKPSVSSRAGEISMRIIKFFMGRCDDRLCQNFIWCACM